MISNLPSRELLNLHAEVSEELRRRGVTRSSNNPVGDYAEHLFSSAFGWTLSGNSKSSMDAIDQEGRRYQIKARRLTRYNSSRQLSALRNLPDRGFDFLAAVLFQEDFSIHRAIILPHEAIEPVCRYSTHVNAWILRLDDSHLSLAGAQDVTEQLVGAAERLV